MKNAMTLHAVCAQLFFTRKVSVIYANVNKTVCDFAVVRWGNLAVFHACGPGNGQEDTQDNAQDVDEGCWA